MCDIFVVCLSGYACINFMYVSVLTHALNGILISGCG